MINEFFKGLRHYSLQLLDHVTLKAIAAAFVGIFGFIFPDGSANVMFVILVLIIMDSIFGIMASVREGKAIESKRLRDTMFKAFLYVLVLVCVHLTDRVISLPFGMQMAYFFNSYIAVNELWSILENAERLGIPVPVKLKEVLKGKLDK